MMPYSLDTMANWRGRAEEARRLGERMADPVVKQVLLEVATAYDRIAEQDKKQSQTDLKPKKNRNETLPATRNPVINQGTPPQNWAVLIASICVSCFG